MTLAVPKLDSIAPTAHARLSRMVCFSIYSAGHALNRVYKPLLDPLGLTYPQYLVLLVLWEENNLTVGKIGQHLLLDSGTLTPLLKRMEGAGLVSRTRDPQDERQVRIALTPLGEQLEEKVALITDELVCALGQSASRLQQLTQEIASLRSSLHIRAGA